jgi:uncharacterized protein (UPF0335 family)
MSDTPATADGGTEIAAPEQLREIIEQIQGMEERKKDVSEEIKDAYAAAKSQGYDPKTIRKIISLLKQDKATRDEADAILLTYMDALGMN